MLFLCLGRSALLPTHHTRVPAGGAPEQQIFHDDALFEKGLVAGFVYELPLLFAWLSFYRFITILP